MPNEFGDRIVDTRRQEDHARFQRLEMNQQELAKTIIKVEGDVKSVQQEQVHAREIFNARFATQDKILEDNTETLRKILDRLEDLIIQPEKTPAGRALNTAIGLMSTEIGLMNNNFKSLQMWQQQAQGAINLIKWVGISLVGMGVLAAGMMLLDLAKSAFGGP